MSHKILEEFVAISEAGKEFHLTITQEMIDAGTLNDPNKKIEGLKSITTSEGYHVNFVDSETFEIVELDLTVRRKDA